MADLLVDAGGRQDADSDVRAVPREIVGLTAIELNKVLLANLEAKRFSNAGNLH
jgi:hypothetical protein